MIRNMVEDGFEAKVDRVMFVDDALKALRGGSFRLVFVNRLIFEDQTEGISLIEAMKRDPELSKIPVMLISNFDSAQTQAVALGAEPGFGKASVAKQRTIENLARFLPPRVATPRNA